MSSQYQTMHKIRAIRETDGRFRPEAYVFTLESLNFALDRCRRRGHYGHIDGRELMLAMRDFARETFGFLAGAVFQEWGVKGTEDFGSIVFNLADAELLSRQESDSLEDFAGVFDFEEAFERTYIHPAAS